MDSDLQNLDLNSKPSNEQQTEQPFNDYGSPVKNSKQTSHMAQSMRKFKVYWNGAKEPMRTTDIFKKQIMQKQQYKMNTLESNDPQHIYQQTIIDLTKDKPKEKKQSEARSINRKRTSQLSTHSLQPLKETINQRDEKLLENRIKLLHNEEQKILKKIDNTRRQAEKIMAIKLHNEEQQRRKIQLQINQDSSIERFREQAKQEKDQQRQRYMELSRTIMDNKRESYLSEKQRRMRDERIKEEYLQSVILENQERKVSVKQQEQQAREKFHKFWEEKLQQAQQNYANKISKEASKVQFKANNINSMESKEAEILRKLQTTQKRQIEVYQQLEDIIKNNRKSITFSDDTP
ncbi:UNKNOWN [Stylonychia lemnae]|uniref:Uncharacterized protein n=1 Tax=Stylonychia lemnae TaxID=5949 RepID=A0A077ZYY2_STYLE|nr:UNKNOWN [Stylonychia lemnae]|eukprot:CDW75166.1 UNKNOWN [Stylonychia lemnae]